MSRRNARADAGAAVAGLFGRTSATGGLAGWDHPSAQPPNASTAREAVTVLGQDAHRVRLGVELSETEVGFLRALSRPSRTGGPRTLGSKFVGTGVLAAAIELLRSVDVDMEGVAAGDLDQMIARARAALVRAALHEQEGSS
jgi:hypothetical protein